MEVRDFLSVLFYDLQVDLSVTPTRSIGAREVGSKDN